MRGLSLPAIHKHVKILENAGLVSRRKTGRTTYLILNPQRLRLLQDWAGQFRTYWGSGQASFENYQSYLGIDPDQVWLSTASVDRSAGWPHRADRRISLAARRLLHP
jgi:hypothetical protein